MKESIKKALSIGLTDYATVLDALFEMIPDEDLKRNPKFSSYAFDISPEPLEAKIKRIIPSAIVVQDDDSVPWPCQSGAWDLVSFHRGKGGSICYIWTTDQNAYCNQKLNDLMSLFYGWVYCEPHSNGEWTGATKRAGPLTKSMVDMRAHESH